MWTFPPSALPSPTHLFALLCLPLVLFGCGGGGSGDGGSAPQPPETVRAEISASGGAITSADGKVTLTFPEGALSGETEISIRRLTVDEYPDDLDGMNIFAAYELLPSGLTFTNPVQIAMNYDFARENNQDPEGPVGLNLLTLSSGVTENLNNIALSNSPDEIFPTERSKMALSGTLDHFSVIAGQITSGEGGSLDRVSVSGLPDVIEVGKIFDVKVKLLHPDLSRLEAERVVFVEHFNKARLDVTEGSKIIFDLISESEPNIHSVSLGAVSAGEASSVTITISYICKQPGFALFDGLFQYQNRDNQNQFERIADINSFVVYQYLLCVDNSVTQGRSNFQAEKPGPEDPDLNWQLEADPIAGTATVGDFIDYQITEEALFDEIEGETAFYWLKILDTNPGIVSDLEITVISGGEDIETEKVTTFYDLDEMLLVTLSDPAKENAQNFRYECVAPGTTLIGLAAYPTAEITGLDKKLSGTGYTYVLANCLADDDKDKISNDEDLCDQVPGAEGQGCPVEKENEFIRFGCENDTNCALGAASGSCTSCTVQEKNTGYEMACGANSTCTSAVAEDDLEMACNGTGDCRFSTGSLTADCLQGAACSYKGSLICEAADSQLCSISIDGQQDAICDNDGPCEISIPATYLDGESSDYEIFTASAETIGGDGVFAYDWEINVGNRNLSDRMQVSTDGGLPAKQAYLLFDPATMDLSLAPVNNALFTLEAGSCDPLASASIGGTLDIDVIAGPVLCLFEYEALDVTETGVFPLPDNATGPREFSFVPRGAFGMSESVLHIAVGTDNGSLVFNPGSGTVPSAGNTRLSFLNDQTESYGVEVIVNSIVENSDLIESYGPNTYLRQYDPVLEQMSFAILGFNNITDIKKLAGDDYSASTLLVNNSLSVIDVRVPDSSRSSGWRIRPLVDRDNLLQLGSAPVSAYAETVGELGCFHPCQGTGQPMTSECAAQIPAIQTVLDTQPSCAGYWSPSTCEDIYNTLTGGQCDLPRTSPEYQVNYGGMVIGVTGGSPSEVFLANPSLTFETPVTVLGEVGNEARRIECVTGWCATTSYASDQLTIIKWDSFFGASIHTSLTIGSGPVGIGMKLEQGIVNILTTGSQDNSYYLTTFNAADGDELISVRRDAPEGCLAPEAIDWKPEPERDLAIMTCRGSDNYAIIRP